MMQLAYHSASFELMGQDAVLDEAAVFVMGEIENRYGVRIPGSLREWYSIAGATEILRAHSNEGTPIGFARMFEPREDTHGGGPHDLLTAGLLPFLYENQAVCVWAIELDGTDDPPVVVDFDSQFSQWSPCSACFSTYVYACIWDQTVVFRDGPLLQANVEPVTETELQTLRDTFSEAPTTHGFPGHTQRRFRRGDQGLLLWLSEEQTDWFVSADSEDSLESLVQDLWHIPAVAEGLYGVTDATEALLARIRAAQR